MPFDYPYTCPDIDKEISDIQECIKSGLQDFANEISPYTRNEDINNVVNNSVGFIYSDIEQTYEGVRKTNEEMRKEAENQVSRLEDEVSNLESRILELEARIEELENELSEAE